MRRSLSILAAATLLFGLLTGVRPAFAVTYVVNSTADKPDLKPGDGLCRAGDSRCTLRAAIMEANAHAGADTITLPAGVYTLNKTGPGEDAAASGDLDIKGDLTINGAGLISSAIVGTSRRAKDRVFQIFSGFSVTIDGVQIRSGSTSGQGGGILNAGTLTLSHTDIEANTAGQGGGIYNESTGTLSIANVWAVNANTTNTTALSSDDGGGIFNAGTLTLGGGQVELNNAYEGAGIFNDATGDLTVSLTTLADNHAAGAGGGIYNPGGTISLADDAFHDNTAPGIGGVGGAGMALTGASSTVTIDRAVFYNNVVTNSRGGGISVSGGTLTVTNVTFSGNTADTGGGGLSNAGAAVSTLNNVTFSNNSVTDLCCAGGNLEQVGGSVAINNTIIANGSAATDPDCRGTVGSTLGHNLIEDTTGCTIGGTTTGNVTGTDPNLAVLSSNGATDGVLTRALNTGSPAIDAGAGTTPGTGCPATDARDSTFTRPKDGDGSTTAECDMGAFEKQS